MNHHYAPRSPRIFGRAFALSFRTSTFVAATRTDRAMALRVCPVQTSCAHRGASAETARAVVFDSSRILFPPFSGQQSLTTSAFDPDGRLTVAAAALGGLWSADVAVVAVIADGITTTTLASLFSGSLRDRFTNAQASTVDSGWVTLATNALLALVAINRPQWPTPARSRWTCR